MMRASFVAMAVLYAYDYVACSGRYAELGVRVISAIERSFV